jgi:uncharacterized protein (TIGR03000 family)
MRIYFLSAVLTLVVPELVLAAPPSQAGGRLPARITVTLPAGARLTIDGEPTRQATTLRTFGTPPLPRGRTFVYTLRAKLRRGGTTLTVLKEVPVRAGRETVLSIRFPRVQATDRGDYRTSYGKTSPRSRRGPSRLFRFRKIPRTRTTIFRYAGKPELINTRTWTTNEGSVFD